MCNACHDKHWIQVRSQPWREVPCPDCNPDWDSHDSAACFYEGVALARDMVRAGLPAPEMFARSGKDAHRNLVAR